MSGKALAQRLAPGWQPLDHECRLKEGRVPVRSAAFQPCGLSGLRDVQQLARLRSELAQQSWQRFTLPDARDVENIPHDHQVRVISEPGRARPGSLPLQDHREAAGR
ncbi:MAG TPA: hypothetical protein VG142_16090 [Trebonia sp.]|nr:hypothetical protein [Trebonia sp.]